MATSEYGVLAIVRTVRDLFSVLYTMGSGTSATRFYYDCKDVNDEKRLFSTLFFFTMGFALFISIFLLVFGEPLWNRVIKDIPFHPYASLTIFTVLMATAGVLPRVLFRVKGQAKLFVKLNFLQIFLIVASSIPLVVVFHMGALGPIISTLVVSVLFFFFFLYYLRGYLSLSFSWKTVKKSLAFGLPDVPVRFGNWALRMANQLILQYYVSLSLVAVYSVGYSVGSIFFELVIPGLHWAVDPFYYQTAKEESEGKAKEIFSYVAVYNVTVILFLALLTILMGKELLSFFAPSKYAGAEPLIVIIAISCIFQFLFFIPSRAFYLMKKTIYLPPLMLVTVVLNVTFSFLLIPKYGIMGAAWATLIAFFSRSVLTLIISQRIYHIPYDYLRIGKAVLAFIIIFIMRNYLPDGPVILLILLKLMVLPLYPALLYFLGFFEKRELARFHMQWVTIRERIFLRS
jgi:O-antigen/teichoic acid export membrane protein